MLGCYRNDCMADEWCCVMGDKEKHNMHFICGKEEENKNKNKKQSWGSRIIRMLCEKAADIFYPRRCPICDDVLEPGILICEKCCGQVQNVKEPVCKRCGKPLEYEREEYCTDCQKGTHVYRQGKAVFIYKEGIRQSMYRFKYSNRREYAAFYAKEAARLYGDWVKKNHIEVIVPIPMYQGKKRRRGYNQAEVFAQALGEELKLPVNGEIVRRVRDTRPQKELNDRERRNNLKNAFQFKSNIVKYKQILLVDDIYTTGSTVDTVADVLLSGGVQTIYYICISIGAGF